MAFEVCKVSDLFLGQVWYQDVMVTILSDRQVSEGGLKKVQNLRNGGKMDGGCGISHAPLLNCLFIFPPDKLMHPSKNVFPQVSNLGTDF